MIARIFLAALLVCSASVAHAQSNTEAVPQSFLEYLEPGMHVRVQSVEGTTDVLLHVYSRQDFETAAKIAEVRLLRPALEAAEKNDAVREELTKFIERHEIPQSETASIRLITPNRTSLATVRVIGSDFILVQFEEETERRKVIPKSRVGAIYLDANPIRFFYHRGNRDHQGDGK